MKTNKTKPIKKLMIFTIITVMIVSLFAVPAFAELPIGIPWEENITTANPFTLQVWDGIESRNVNTAGFYGITFNVDTLIDDILQYSVTDVTVYPFNPPDDENSQPFGSYGYFSGVNFDGGDSSGALSLNMRDGDNAYFYFRYNSNHSPGREWEIIVPRVNSSSTYNLRDYTSITFYVFSYPPDALMFNTQTINFWNNASSYYSVIHYVEETVDPDPEEPTDPTPPADGEEQGIFAVWSKITQWIVQGLASVSNAFYADGKLTLLGTLCIIPLALGLAFLLIGIIQKFLRLRG